MKYLRSKHAFSILVAWCLICTSAYSESTFNSLTVDVALLENGDARVVQTWDIHVDGGGTELYIPIQNIRDHGIDITDFMVTDEQGREYEVLDEWDSDRSASFKANKCGIITKSDGYELCWGLGEDGDRIYTVSYGITGLVQGYSDYDGFNHMFVNQNLSPSPQEVSVFIHDVDDRNWEEGTVRMWSFMYNGEVVPHDGGVLATTSGPLDSNEAMVVMLQFDKGIFNPSKKHSDSFETVKEQAMEGSDYVYAGKQSLWENVKEWFFILIGPICLLGLFLFKFVRVKGLKNKIKKNLLWYRECPYGGDLRKANAVLNACKYGKPEYKNLVTASAVRLLSIGALRVEEHYVEATGMKKMMGGQPKLMKCLVIGELKEVRGLKVTRMLKLLYDLFVDAAGEDRILQPKEFKRFVNSHKDRLVEFMDEAMYKMTVKECKNDIDRVKQVFGLKKFLEDFTLANERSVQEVALWGDYLVYAELFGNAKQLRKEMLKINPEFAKMSDIYQAMFDDSMMNELVACALLSSSVGSAGISARDGGSGGFSSFGGGGGFSGGGSGGGIR